jgi:hypothetical protein
MPVADARRSGLADALGAAVAQDGATRDEVSSQTARWTRPSKRLGIPSFRQTARTAWRRDRFHKVCSSNMLRSEGASAAKCHMWLGHFWRSKCSSRTPSKCQLPGLKIHSAVLFCPNHRRRLTTLLRSPGGNVPRGTSPFLLVFRPSSFLIRPSAPAP